MKRLAGFLAVASLGFAIACAETDAGITTSVKSKLAADDTVKAYQVDVTTENGVVTLSGDVETAAQKEHAVTLARNTDGVRDVIDRLEVNPTAATSGRIDVDGDDIDADTRVDEDAEAAGREGANRIEEGARRGAEAVKDGAKKVGDEIEDAVTDDEPDR
jgi:hypothetical protein